MQKSFTLKLNGKETTPGAYTSGMWIVSLTNVLDYKPPLVNSVQWQGITEVVAKNIWWVESPTINDALDRYHLP